MRLFTYIIHKTYVEFCSASTRFSIDMLIFFDIAKVNKPKTSSQQRINGPETKGGYERLIFYTFFKLTRTYY